MPPREQNPNHCQEIIPDSFGVAFNVGRHMDLMQRTAEAIRDVLEGADAESDDGFDTRQLIDLGSTMETIIRNSLSSSEDTSLDGIQ